MYNVLIVGMGGISFFMMKNFHQSFVIRITEPLKKTKILKL